MHDSIASQNRWNDDDQYSAFQKNFFNACTTTKNPNGYYYYKGGTTPIGRLLTIFGDDNQPPSPPLPIPRTAPKRLLINNSRVLYVIGADVQIDSDIEYGTTGTNPSLVIIVQKDNQGNGGNILIDPKVQRIDATLIADGTLLN